MKNTINFIAITLLGACSVCAQNPDSHMPTLGLKVGIPVTDMFSTGQASTATLTSGTGTSSFAPFAPGSVFTSSVPRYEFGVSAEFHLPLHLRFEVDGLFKRGGFDNTGFYGNNGIAGYSRTSFNQWEIPGLFKYNIAMGHFRPFIDLGASYRHISTINQRTYADGLATLYADNSPALRNRNSFGGVAGFGITFKKGPFELTPEARYTRWANSAFATDGLRSNKDQGDILLGISF